MGAGSRVKEGGGEGKVRISSMGDGKKKGNKRMASLVAMVIAPVNVSELCFGMFLVSDQ